MPTGLFTQSIWISGSNLDVFAFHCQVKSTGLEAMRIEEFRSLKSLTVSAPQILASFHFSACARPYNKVFPIAEDLHG